MPKPDLYKMIVKKFPQTSSWKEFVKILGANGIKESDSSGSLLSRLDGLIQKFNQSLEETYIADWSAKGYMTPNCFFYLMGRLVILASQYSCSFFTTKSAFVEWLMYHESGANSSASMVTVKQPCLENVFEFLIDVVQQFLFDSRDIKEWIRSCKINLKYNYPVLVLRLFVILCLLCLNSGMHANVLFELLDTSQIRFQLPREFCEALQRERKYYHNELNANAVAEAFKIIGNPLVIVNLGKNNPDFECPNAIFLDMGGSSGKKDILEVLFPRSNESSHVQVSFDEELWLNLADHHCEISSVPPLKVASKLGHENGNVKLQINWGVLQEISDMLKSGENRKNENLKVMETFIIIFQLFE